MIKIKFNNEEIFREVEFIRTEHTVTLKGIVEENITGFKTYRLSGENLGDFSDFTTVYRKGENFIEYSNNGSVYEEPIQPTYEELRKQNILSEISTLKQELTKTDYQAIKYAEGWYTDEEYAPIKDMREEIREKIRYLESQLEN